MVNYRKFSQERKLKLGEYINLIRDCRWNLENENLPEQNWQEQGEGRWLG